MQFVPQVAKSPVSWAFFAISVFARGICKYAHCLNKYANLPPLCKGVIDTIQNDIPSFIGEQLCHRLMYFNDYIEQAFVSSREKCFHQIQRNAHFLLLHYTEKKPRRWSIEVDGTQILRLFHK